MEDIAEKGNWYENTNEKLKKEKSKYRVINLNIIYCLIFAIIIFLGGILYLSYNGYFKDNINQNVNLEPQINITGNTKVSIDDKDTNKFEFTFNLDEKLMEAYCNSSG